MATTPRARVPVAGIEHEPLTDDQVAAALLDPCVFTDRHCWIRAKGGKQEHFRLWPFQREVMECFDDESRVLVLKARQLGISWLADAYALWLCSANHGQTVMILSQGQRESKEEMRRIRFMHTRLPPELKRRTGVEVADAHTPDTTEHLEFPDMDSRIISLPSTEHAGTSYTATQVIIHELAKIATAANLIAAITPTMADDGRLFVVSTAFGFSGTFYDYWQENGDRWHTGQVVGDSGEEGSFRPIFIPWHARPGRTKRWYAATSKALKKGTMKQEYPACLVASTRVSTQRGLIPIAEAQAGDVTESGTVTAAGPQPVSQTYRLITTGGRTLQGTGDHPCHTPSGEFILLQDLQPGQELTLRAPRFGLGQVVVELPSLPGVRRTVQVDERWGRFLGYFMGDGSVYGAGQVSVVCDHKDPDVVDDVRSLLTDLVGVPAERQHHHGPVSSHRPDNGAVELRVQRKEAVEVLAALGACDYDPGSGKSKRRVCVPEVIWRSPQPVVREFLRGLFESDGSASGRVVRWGSSKEGLVQDTQLLLLGFGINAPISARHFRRSLGGRPGATYRFWWLNFPTLAGELFHDQIGFVSERKSALRPQPKVRKLLKPHRLVDQVLSVETTEPEITYDLTVESEHVFSANGILTHNTPTEAFQGSADACFAEEFDRYQHCIDATRNPTSPFEVVHGLDLGVNNAYAYLIEVQGATAFVFDEIHLENDTVDSLGYATCEMDRDYNLDPMECVTYPDPAGIARNPQTLQTDYDVLKECGLLVDDSSLKVSPAQRVDQIKKMLKAGRLWIGFNCPDLINALEKAQWKRRRGPGGVLIREDTYEKDGTHEHPLDALGYALSRVWPPYEPAAADNSSGLQASGSRTRAIVGSYSGSEFGG